MPKLEPPWFELFETLTFTESVVREKKSEPRECDKVPTEEDNVVELAVEDVVPFPGAETKPGEEDETATMLTLDGDDAVDEFRDACVGKPGFEPGDTDEVSFIAPDIVTLGGEVADVDVVFGLRVAGLENPTSLLDVALLVDDVAETGLGLSPDCVELWVIVVVV